MWFWYALGAAVFSAVTVVLNKRVLQHTHASVLSWALFAFPIPLLLYLAFKDGLPQVNQWFFVGTVGSGIVFTFVKTSTNASIKQGILSKLYPLSAFSALFSYVMGLVFLNEHIRLIPLLGLLTILIGAYILNADQITHSILRPILLILYEPAARIYIFAMFLGSVSGIFDKIGLTNVTPANPALVLLTENIVMTIILTVYLLHSEKQWQRDLRIHFWPFLLNSFLYLMLAFFVF